MLQWDNLEMTFIGIRHIYRFQQMRQNKFHSKKIYIMDVNIFMMKPSTPFKE